MDFLSRGLLALSRCAPIGDRSAKAARHPGRRLSVEQLEARNLLALSHLYTFNDGLTNDWIGNAHGTLFNGATIAAGKLVLANAGVTSGQTGVVQYMKLPASVLPTTGSFTVEAWFTTSDATNWQRVFDIGDQTGANGNSYVFYSPLTSNNDSRGVIRPTGGGAERIATGVPTNDGVEHLASVVVDTANDLLHLYIDGVEASTAPLAGANAASINDTLAYLGRSLFNADPGFTGSINELRIFDDARSADSILMDAAAGPSTLTKSPQVRQVEYLNRGVVAVRKSSTQTYVGWRLLGTDPSNIAFNLYRSIGAGAAVKLNASPLTTTTDYVDTPSSFSSTIKYYVRPVINGSELAPSETYTLAANEPVRQFLNVPLQTPAGGTVPDYQNPGMFLPFAYNANDASVGDVDGDGQYEIFLKWDPDNSKDNSQSGYTGNTLIDCYRLNGTLLWRIDLGQNIRAGAHYTQFSVYDFDGDGKAEVVMRTAPGTKDGLGNYVLLGSDNPATDYRNSNGYNITSPEYLTVFDGLTGANRVTVPYLPNRGSASQWGDSYGNRVDRLLMDVAYLDGVHPSLVVGRGIFGPQSGFSARNELTAWNFNGTTLTNIWWFKASTSTTPSYIGQGVYTMIPADVDGDGKDEIIYGAMAIDDNGAPLYSTSYGHGDALHVGDMDPTRPGLEVFMPQETTSLLDHRASVLRDARTGQLLAAPFVTDADIAAGTFPDVGRGVAADIDPNHVGYEFWESYSPDIYDAQGNSLYAKPSNMFINFAVYWDADPQSELLDGTTISQWNNPGRSNFDLDPATSGTQSAPNAASNNGTKSTPSLQADIFGDWREEVIWRRSDNTALEIFTTTISATSRTYTLMHDSQYREAVAWQNVGYDQPPHTSFLMAGGAPTPQMSIVPLGAALTADFNGDRRVDALDFALWKANAGKTALTPGLVGDANGDLVVDGQDFLLWQQNAGAAAAVVAASAQAVSIDAAINELAGAGLPASQGVASPRMRSPLAMVGRSKTFIPNAAPSWSRPSSDDEAEEPAEPRAPRRLQFARDANSSSVSALDSAHALTKSLSGLVSGLRR